MHTFKDAVGREWSVTVDIAALEAVEAATKDRVGGPVELWNVEKGDTFAALSDPFVLSAVLWPLCREQAGKSGVSNDQFTAGIRGDTLEAAPVAVFKAVGDFLPTSRRTMLLAALHNGREAADEAHRRQMKAIEDGHRALMAALTAAPSTAPTDDAGETK